MNRFELRRARRILLLTQAAMAAELAFIQQTPARTYRNWEHGSCRTPQWVEYAVKILLEKKKIKEINNEN